MGDNSNIAHEKFKKVQLETTVSRKTIVKRYRKSSKSIKRKNRRKRSKKTYFNMLRNGRMLRGTEELCNSIREFSVTDMDMKPMSDVNKLPEEVIEWQKQDQIAYWKSRAIGLEIENKMLRQHLRHVYAQQTEYYEQNKGWQEIAPTHDNKEQQQNEKSASKNLTEKKKTDNKHHLNTLKSKESTLKVLPKEPQGKNRLQEMEKIYGDMAPKIMGMETAIELNYERLQEEGSRVYWPNIPLKL